MQSARLLKRKRKNALTAFNNNTKSVFAFSAISPKAITL